MQQLSSILRENPYPGRGIVLGRHASEDCGMVAYFIMGRSENSRNRVFIEKNGDIYTQAAQAEKLQDPSLIIYTPVRQFGQQLIVTNGDQTDTIFHHLEQGANFVSSLESRTFEPDAPNFTPRISGIIGYSQGALTYKLAILKSEGQGRSLRRFFWEYPQPLAGEGHFIHTYETHSDPLPPFLGEPRSVEIQGSLKEFGDCIWDSLNNENKISLYVCCINEQGVQDWALYNKYAAQ